MSGRSLVHRAIGPVVFASLLLCALMRPAYSDNLLINPGFETGNFTGWTVTANTPTYGVATAGTPIPGTDFGPMDVVVHSGNYAAYALTCPVECAPSGDVGGDFLTLSQTLDLVAGTTYEIGFWFGDSDPAGTFGNESRIEVNGSVVQTGGPGFTTDYQFEDVLYTPTSSGAATVSFVLEGSGTGDAGLSFDDFQVSTVSSVPEPSAILPLSGLLALLAGKRYFDKIRA